MTRPITRTGQPRRKCCLPQPCVGLHHHIATITGSQELVDGLDQPLPADKTIHPHLFKHRGRIQPHIPQTREPAHEHITSDHIPAGLDHRRIGPRGGLLLQRQRRNRHAGIRYLLGSTQTSSGHRL
jgi:hypothetical protein